MHDIDKEELEAICGGIIPVKTRELYDLYQEAWGRRHNGPMDSNLLMVVAVTSGAVKKRQREPHAFDSVEPNTPVRVLEYRTTRQYCQGLFLGVGSGLHDRMIEVALWGDPDERQWFQESQVLILTERPDWLIEAQSPPQPTPRPQEAVEPEEDDSDAVDPTDVEAEEMTREQKDEVLLKHPFFEKPIGMELLASPEGRDQFVGVFLGLDEPTGLIRVQAPLPTGKKKKDQQPEVLLLDIDEVRVRKDEDGREIIKVLDIGKQEAIA